MLKGAYKILSMSFTHIIFKLTHKNNIKWDNNFVIMYLILFENNWVANFYAFAVN
jgi:hypothetical protein